jgi:F-type H+-transporting ATPase subunit a
MITVSEAEKAEKKFRWRWGVNRWFFFAVFGLGIWITGKFPAARPAIFLPAEAVLGSPENPLFMLGDFPIYLTNTLIATAIADVLLLLLAFLVVRPAYRKGKLEVPKGLGGVVEGLSEIFYNLTESTAGKWTRTIFPWFAVISFLVLTLNWMELIPGVDAFGVFEPSHYVHAQVEGLEEQLSHDELEAAEHAAEEHYFEMCHVDPVFSIGETEVVTVYVNDEYEEGLGECAHAIVPFVRAGATDLNFTVALAIISVVMIQVIGVRSLGLHYFEKFINVRTLFSKPAFGVIDFVVGLFEIISEISKIISFSFRLFGNIFAGAVLLFVLGTLIPVGAQAAVLALEFMVGMIQAIVFGMLTMIFMSQATHSHFDDEEHH